MDNLETALIIALSDSIKWSAALPAAGTLTTIDPGQPLDILEYARRDREFQHRDVLNAAAVAKVCVHAQTVWSGTLPHPRLQGVTGVQDYTGTNVQLTINAGELSSPQPVTSSQVYFVGNTSIPYDTVNTTDKALYSRDALVYETLARAAAIFPTDPPIRQNDPAMALVGETSIWATAEGTNRAALPNAAQALNPALFGAPDAYLAERDNQVAAYVARTAQALKNPFEFATRVYVAIVGSGERESETYVLTNNVFTSGQTYATGEEATYAGLWYRANYTTADVPGGAAWALISAPTLRQFLAEPALSSRNRIVYNTSTKTLQWYRENLDTIHVPQIVGFYVPGVLPGQAIQTVPLTPERKDGLFYRQKAARVCLANGSWASVYNIHPTGGELTDGDMDTLFQSAKALTLMTPSSGTVHFTGITCQPGSYTLTALVRPASTVYIAGIDLDGGTGVPANDGVNFTAINTTLRRQIALPAGLWTMYIEFANDVSATSQSLGFGIKATLDSRTILSDTLPLYYTDSAGSPLPNGTLVQSQGIAISSEGHSHNLGITWTTGTGVFHIRRLILVSTDNATSRYSMSATWNQAVPPYDYTARLDVLGQRDVPDVMPFSFYVAAPSVSPRIELAWLAGETQIPLLVEQLHLQKWTPTTPTPMTTGFSAFKQDMLERTARFDQDAYRAAIASSGSIFPEFRSGGTVWEIDSTGSWMDFLEVYNPRVREQRDIPTGSIVGGHTYQVEGAAGVYVVYFGGTYPAGQLFHGTVADNYYLLYGAGTVVQQGAYRLALPGDVGQPALVPAGLEFVLSAGTVAGWYASYASYPTLQALQPWMLERGIYAAQPEFWSPPTM